MRRQAIRPLPPVPGFANDPGYHRQPDDMNAHAHHTTSKPLLRHRKNVDLLLPNQLAALRQGFKRLQEISDNVVTDKTRLPDFGDLPLGRDMKEPLLFDSISLVTYETPPLMPPVSPAEAERPAPEPE